MKPFVKWVGGKRQLLNQFQNLYPDNFDIYVEPFVGAGAVFFDIIQKYKPKKIILNDLNNNLINLYNDIKLSCDKTGEKRSRLIEKLLEEYIEKNKDKLN